MQTIIMWIMALGAVLGGFDYLFGNRMGLGKRFEEGFSLLGPTALSMTGILCLSPLLAKLLTKAVVPLWGRLGLDPGMLGGLLAIDMGGYQLATALAQNASIGRYSGIVIAATLGCTLTFTIPVGTGLLPAEDRPVFGRGIVIGLCVLPLGIILGGLLCEITLRELLRQSLPVIVLSLPLAGGMFFFPQKMGRGFAAFAGFIRALSVLGLILGTVEYLTGWAVLPGLMPIGEAMQTVSAIGIVMLGSLPSAELLQRVLKRPLDWLGRRTGLNQASLTGLLVGGVSVLPALTLFPQMDKRGKLVNGAFLVGAASALAAHLGFTFAVDRAMVPALLAAKFTAGFGAAIIAVNIKRIRVLHSKIIQNG